MTAFQHRQSAHCESGVMASLLTHAGLPMSEPMAFGLASGLAFAYLPIVKIGGMPLIAYRMPPRHLIKTLSKRLGVRLTSRTFSNPEQGRVALDAALDSGRLAGLQSSVFWLPYFPPEMRFHFNAHNLLAYGRDGDEYLLSDPVFEAPVRCASADLQKARFAKGALAAKGLMYYLDDVSSEQDWERLIRQSVLSTSRIGFKGAEDLGNGLKAIFTLEYGLLLDQNEGIGASNNGVADARQQFVGLTGGFGTVVGGTLTHPLRAMGAKVELAPGATGLGTTMSVTGRIAGTATGADDRASNAIAYVSPSFGGFSGTVAYINGETQPNGADRAEARAYQLAGQYDNGPLYVAAGYHAAKNIAGVDSADARIYRVAAVYTLPTKTKLTALYDNTKVDNATGFDKRHAWSLGVAQSFGKNTVGVEYGAAGKIKDETGSLADTKAQIWTALYTYELSKRTSVHARYSKLTNEGAINNNFYINPVSNGVTTGAGSDYTGYMVGLRHAF